MHRLKLLLTTVAAIAVVGTLTATADATRLEVSSNSLRAVFREVILEGIFGRKQCEMTLEGTFHSRTITKSVGTLLGYITAARLGPCAVGTATILTETLPWHIQYAGFEGTLPTGINNIRTNVIGYSYRMRTNTGENCLSRSTAANPAVMTYNISAGVIVSANLGGSIPTGPECFGATGRLSSNAGPVTQLGNITRVSVRLI